MQVLKAGARAKDLTRQLLAFSRRQVLDPKVLDLNEVVRGMEKMLVRLLPEHTRVVSDLAPDLGRVLADRGQVEQVLMNLVVNARDAMPDGGKVAIETRNAEIDEAYALAHAGTPAGKYVLLVEDEPEVRAVVRRFLELHGYDVTEAADGQEGLEVAERSARRFDLLLTDIVMPRLGGKVLATRLAWARPELRVVLMTGYTDDAGLRQGDLPEGWTILQKPFTSRALAERLRDALRPRAPYA